MFKWLSLIVQVIMLGLITPAQASENITAAACLIKADNQLVMVRDAYNRRLALPGGMRNVNETAEQTALRETFEETGIKASIIKPLANWGAVAIFLCQANMPIKAHPSMEDKTSSTRIYAYGAPDVGREILRVLLVDINHVAKQAMRLPYRFAELKQLFNAQVNTSHVDYIDNIFAQASRWHQIELQLIQQFQQRMGHSTELLFTFFNAFGEGKIYYLLLPLIWITLGWQCGAKLVLLLLISNAVNAIMKICFGLPRPFDYIPIMQQAEISGFGLPSGHTQTAAIFWGFLYAYYWRAELSWAKYYLLALTAMLIMGTGLARLYFGVHFISDIVVGGSVGLLLLLGFTQLDRHGALQSWLALKSRAWFIVLVTLVTATLLSYSFHVLASLSIALGLYCGLKTTMAGKFQPLIQQTWQRKINFIVLALLGAIAINSAAIWLQQYLFLNTQLAALLFMQYFINALWLSAGCYFLIGQFLGLFHMANHDIMQD